MNFKLDYLSDMRRHALKVIVYCLFIIMIVFIVSTEFTRYLSYEMEARDNLTKVSESFRRLYEANDQFLNDTNVLESIHEGYLTNDFMNFDNQLIRFNNMNRIDSKIFMMNTQNEVLFTTLNQSQLTNSYVSYSGAIAQQMALTKSKDTRTFVYKGYESYPDYLMIKTLYNDTNTLMGYIVLHISGADWSYHTQSTYNHNAIITDTNGNVVLFNRPTLLQNKYVFSMLNRYERMLNVGDDAYWVVHQQIPGLDLIVYSLVYTQPNKGLYLIIAMVFVVGVSLYFITVRFIDQLANRTAESVNNLVEQLSKIADIYDQQRLSVATSDEFAYIADKINDMLDAVNRLNKEKSDLMTLNNQIEINHLTAQFNPHFLYNTLEIIRNMIFIDEDEAEDLIVKLTSILQYSIDNSLKDVRFLPDLKYMMDYIEIQSVRFGDRFKVTLDLDDTCNTCVIPKLMLQPIIENSIKYGYSKNSHLELQIYGICKNDMLRIVIRDNGGGMSPRKLEHTNRMLRSKSNRSKSNGLYNISRRLQLLYGPTSGIYLDNGENGLIVTILADQRNTRRL